MNITMQLAVVAVACLCLVDSTPEGRMVRSKQQRPTRGFKNVEMMTARGFGKRDRPPTRAERDVENSSNSYRISRPTFKSPSAGVARENGKRTSEQDLEDYGFEAPRRRFRPKTSLMVASDFGKRSGNDDNQAGDEVYGMDNIWEMLEGSPEREGQDSNDEKNFESIPLDWFTNELLNNPDLARSVVRKFIDVNQDNTLSSEELLRNVA